MEWIDQFQQLLGRPVLDFVREYWMHMLVALTAVAWWFFGGVESRDVMVSIDLTIGDAGGD
ncbi:MAG: hypothetical protein ACYC0C_11200 [Devosia sp.]